MKRATFFSMLLAVLLLLAACGDNTSEVEADQAPDVNTVVDGGAYEEEPDNILKLEPEDDGDDFFPYFRVFNRDEFGMMAAVSKSVVDGDILIKVEVENRTDEALQLELTDGQAAIDTQPVPASSQVRLGPLEVQEGTFVMQAKDYQEAGFAFDDIIFVECKYDVKDASGELLYTTDSISFNLSIYDFEMQ